MTQRASVLLEKFGKLAVQTRPIPTPAADQLLVRLKASAINPIDWKIQKYGLLFEKFPAILGTDGAGVVESFGNDVTGFKKGDRVLFQGQYPDPDQALFQEYAVVPADLVGKIPENITHEQATTIPLGSQTSIVGIFKDGGYQFPENGPVASGDPILILGGASSVGQFGIQLARIAGFSPIITTASLSNEALLKKLGATHVIDRNDANAATAIRKLAPSLKLVFDTIGLKDTQKLGLDSIDSATKEGKLNTVLPIDKDVGAEANARENAVTVTNTWGSGHANKAFSVPFYKAVTSWLSEGTYVSNAVEVIDGGLEGLQKAFDKSAAGVHAVKLVINP